MRATGDITDETVGLSWYETKGGNDQRTTCGLYSMPARSRTIVLRIMDPGYL